MPKALGPLMVQGVLLLDTEIWVHKKRRLSLAQLRDFIPLSGEPRPEPDSATTVFFVVQSWQLNWWLFGTRFSHVGMHLTLSVVLCSSQVHI